MSATLTLSEDPLRQAYRALSRISRTARLSALLPFPILAAALAGFFHLDAKWYLNPFLALLFVLFALGQIMILRQMRRVLAGARNTAKLLEVLKQAGDEPDLDALRLAIQEKAPPGHLRDLLLRWIELGLRGVDHGYDGLLENASERRSLHDSRLIQGHVSLNRTTLKVGFLGTLYGLLITFPPMKNAVMGLADSEGEMKFIRDISAAIEGDELAILITLGATALSVLIELVTIQILERTLGGFDTINTHINDWNLTRLQPLIRKLHAATAARKAEDLDQRLGTKLAEAQAEMDRNLNRTLEAIARTSKQIEMIAQAQVVVGKRVQELVDYEKQYRGFLGAKQQAAAPAHLRADGNGSGHVPASPGANNSNGHGEAAE
ncbi:MAG TPA: hypothetical protein VK465_11545 [Fibrobacteria bacterium]|nr:hypothetical protein [Fibrobacteria bacterium]